MNNKLLFHRPSWWQGRRRSLWAQLSRLLGVGRWRWWRPSLGRREILVGILTSAYAARGYHTAVHAGPMRNKENISFIEYCIGFLLLKKKTKTRQNQTHTHTHTQKKKKTKKTTTNKQKKRQKFYNGNEYWNANFDFHG